MEKQKNAVGRRKEAVTRVFLSKGDGKITVTIKIIKNISHWFTCRTRLKLPLKTIEGTR